MMADKSAATQTPSIGQDQIDLLERLCNASGVSGDEGEVRKIVLEQVRPLADEVRVDALGSVLAVRHARGVENPLRVMLDAHMDEVGLLIVSDEDNGLYRFVKIGGIDDRALPGKMVVAGKDRIPGVIGAKAIHLTEPGETENKIPLDTLRIDIGPGGNRLKAGDRATFATPFRAAGPSIICKAFDNRVGCAVLIEVLRAAAETGALDHLELMVAFAVQEEIGARGARVAAYSLDPEVAFAIDSTPASDLPRFDAGEDGEIEDAAYNVRLGHGPAIYLVDAGTLSDPRLARHLMATGDRHAIPYQVRQPGSGGTDAGTIHKTRAGVPAISMSVPARYLHTAASLARRADWENTQALLWRALEGLDREILAQIR
jgi:tetrahedral aminopeptidase